MKRILLLLSLLSSFQYANSQATTCAGATSITVNGACGGAATITDATMEGPNPSCAIAAPIREGWYTFTIATTQNITITGDISNRNLVIQLFSGACGSLTEIDCENSGGAGVDEVLVHNCLAAGTYKVRITNVGSNDLPLVSLCITSTPCTAPSNDDPCSATAVTVGSSCSFTTYTNANATATAGVPAPGCANYNGGDVWFTAVVPANGSLSLDGTTGVVLDGGAAIYTGTCGALTLFACDDDSSPDDAMPMINATGLTPGSTVFIRFWEYGSDNNGTFGLCVYDPCPPCAGTPAGGTTNATLTVLCGQSTTLSTTGSVTGCGYTYQWQSSSDNVSWTNIPGATSETYVASPNADIYYRRIVTCPTSGNSGTSASIFIDVTPGPLNDDPCNASALTVGTSCSYNTYSTQCATNSVATVGAPTPTCANYNGGDVWFTVTVPSGGSLTFDSNTGVITDLGMAIYSGTCGSLTQISCDDDGSANGTMSMIAATGLTPGSTIWVRCWEYGNDNPGTFQLCVYDPCPPCSGSPTGGTAVATPAATTCGAPNTTLTLVGSSTGCGFSYQWQSSPDNATWTSISGATSASLTTPVTTNTYFRCIISCIASGTSSNSTSVLVTTTIANTCSFTISTPSYSPDAAYTAGTLLTFPDDQMSAVIPLGFTFCFMGTNYTQCVVSSNAFISFNTGSSGGYSSWVTVAIPTATPAETLNSIMFPWHDVDPSVGVSSDIRYLTIGSAPNRKFIVNFSAVPMFSGACNAQLYTGQLVINETTNIIETYIQDKPICPSWNGGRAVHGINGPDGCSGVVVAGRNNTVWGSVGMNDAKLFTPTGCCNTALSAEIISFDGEQLSSDKNRIFWTTATETNLEKFIIEKSENGQDFYLLGEVPATGNSSTTINYSTLDNSPYAVATYYRLRQIDRDGSETYSNIIKIDNSNWNGFVVLNVYPNPSDAMVFSEIISSEEMNCIMEIKDISGRILYSGKYSLGTGNTTLSFDISEYESGVYFFNFMEEGNNKNSAFRIIKR